MMITYTSHTPIKNSKLKIKNKRFYGMQLLLRIKLNINISVFLFRKNSGIEKSIPAV
ncbi:hypothetical protein IX321_002647 [Bacteroides pyogenes]|nr:hypothetical protein [Bacteroides pyogenes]MBR8718725.1 hypothetical protein [Bacteroides pyogenes]MBR8748192.1 hypothetical protein [Bacteroides pyogenes]MBR8758469.1 hypothetical protein [Bacteroides pyogenes]MBR8781692.1 hypothetical protein [Bacteroides pyogenes]